MNVKKSDLVDRVLKVIKKDIMHRKNTISIGGIWGSIFTPILTTIKKMVAKNIKYIPLLNLI